MKFKVSQEVRFSKELKKRYSSITNQKYFVLEIKSHKNYCLICRTHHQKSIICKKIDTDETVWFTECEIKPSLSLKKLINKILNI